jgi:hypothetical protein
VLASQCFPQFAAAPTNGAAAKTQSWLPTAATTKGLVSDLVAAQEAAAAAAVKN